MFGIVPYIMPGFDLALKAAQVYEQDPTVKGLLLLKHGKTLTINYYQFSKIIFL